MSLHRVERRSEIRSGEYVEIAEAIWQECRTKRSTALTYVGTIEYGEPRVGNTVTRPALGQLGLGSLVTRT